MISLRFFVSPVFPPWRQIWNQHFKNDFKPPCTQRKWTTHSSFTFQGNLRTQALGPFRCCTRSCQTRNSASERPYWEQTRPRLRRDESYHLVGLVVGLAACTSATSAHRCSFWHSRRAHHAQCTNFGIWNSQTVELRKSQDTFLYYFISLYVMHKYLGFLFFQGATERHLFQWHNQTQKTSMLPRLQPFRGEKKKKTRRRQGWPKCC